MIKASGASRFFKFYNMINQKNLSLLPYKPLYLLVNSKKDQKNSQANRIESKGMITILSKRAERAEKKYDGF